MKNYRLLTLVTMWVQLGIQLGGVPSATADQVPPAAAMAAQAQLARMTNQPGGDAMVFAGLTAERGIHAANARVIRVRVSSDSGDAARTLYDKLVEKGAKHGLTFHRVAADADYSLIISWQAGGIGYRRPVARVGVYDRANAPLYNVERYGNFTRSSAAADCAKFIVEDLARRLARAQDTVSVRELLRENAAL